MTWLVITILSYFILAVVFLVDKYLLTSSIPNSKVYVFYVGILGILSLILAPFVGFYIPGISQIILGLSAGATFIFGLFWFYKGLSLFEASRIVPAVGGLIPLFTFGFVYVFSRGRVSLSLQEIIAFLFLLFGSVFIVSEKDKFINLKSLKISLIASFFVSLSSVLIKYVYLSLPFWSGFIWKNIGGFLMALCFFIIFPEIKKEIFKNRTSEGSEGEEEGKALFARREKSNPQKATVFLTNQAIGGGASVLQNWAIALAPLVYVAFINVLQGVQYVFLLIFSVFLSLKFPQILKEEISKGILVQKIIAIIVIGGGLALLVI